MSNDDWLLFAKVAQYRSFSEAARRLGIPTTTVSRRIQQLESQLGERLFIRSTRNVALTELGLRLLPKTKRLETALEELRTTIENNSIDITGKLKLSTSGTLAQFLIPNLVASFSTQYPLVKVDISSSNRNEKIINESIDFSFRIGYLEDSNLIAYKICEIEYVFVASSQFIANSDCEITLSALEQLPCTVINIDGKNVPWLISENNSVIELNINKKYQVDSLYVAKSLAKAGCGIALLPKFIVKNSINAGTLITLLDDTNIQRNPLNLIYFDKHFLSDKSKVFLQHIKDQHSHLENMINPVINS